MLKEIIFALWFFAPAGIANAAPIFAARIPKIKNWNAPMDLGKTFHGKRLLGSHKTWRGLIAGMIASTLVLWFQQYLVRNFGWAQTITTEVNYAVLPTLILGPLFGLGALGGDAVESFFKRQLDFPPGKGWFPLDQTDYIIGGAIVSLPFVNLSIIQYIVLLFLWLLMHMFFSYIGYLVGLKERPI